VSAKASVRVSSGKAVARQASGIRRADRGRESRFGAQSMPGDESEVVRPAAQLLDEVGDQIVEAAILADQADQRLARDRPGGGEDGRLDPEHPLVRAGGRRPFRELDVQPVFTVSPAATRCGAHRPYSRNVGRPHSSRTAPSRTSRSNSRRAARSVIDAVRAASAGDIQSSAKSKSTTSEPRLARSLGATASRVSERRER
jgi:hypothetical protein